MVNMVNTAVNNNIYACLLYTSYVFLSFYFVWIYKIIFMLGM